MSAALARTIVMCALSQSGEPPSKSVEALLYQVAMTTTGHQLEGHVVVDVSTGERTRFGRLEDAARHARELGTQGRRAHLGPMGLSPEIRRDYKLTVEAAFDTCTAVGVASLELERLAPRGSRSGAERLHVALATYWSPSRPDDVQAIEWGARVLATPAPDIAKLAASASQSSPGSRRRVFFDAGLPAPAKWERR